MIKKYILYRKHILCLFVMMDVILLLVNYLYGHPISSILYSIEVLTFLLIIYFIADYIKFYEKQKQLKDIHKHLSTDKQQLPSVKDPMEEQYQTIILSLYDVIKDNVENLEKVHFEQVEYYTMWVHQIKTPISAMRLALQSGKVNGKEELLEQELFKIEQYVELALQYTKLNNLSNDLVIREYELEDIVRHSVKKYAQLFIYKKLTIHIENITKTVVTDSKWLSFLLEQLLSNAIKYTNQGGIKISYENNTLRIEDSGIGIREEDRERIFEKGYTGYNGRLDKRASGIGLYLAKKVADSLAIRINIQSEVGKGTSVMLSFPVENNTGEL